MWQHRGRSPQDHQLGTLNIHMDKIDGRYGMFSAEIIQRPRRDRNTLIELEPREHFGGTAGFQQG